MCDIGKTKAVHKDEAPPIIIKPQPIVEPAKPIEVKEPVLVGRARREDRV